MPPIASRRPRRRRERWGGAAAFAASTTGRRGQGTAGVEGRGMDRIIPARAAPRMVPSVCARIRRSHPEISEPEAALPMRNMAGLWRKLLPTEPCRLAKLPSGRIVLADDERPVGPVRGAQRARTPRDAEISGNKRARRSSEPLQMVVVGL